jgi:hypothetical protein
MKKEYVKLSYWGNRDRTEYLKELSSRRKERYRTFGDYFISNTLKGAKTRNKNKLKKPFTITKDYLKEIFPYEDQRCPVLGIKFKVRDGFGGALNSASLDRIDNDKGYEIGNVIWVCNKVNQIKSSATPDEIIKVGEFYKKLFKERSLE